jgi:hypothetical protein
MKKTLTTTVKYVALCVALLTFGKVQAQEASDIFRLGLEARFDYLNETVDGNKLDAASGFKVRYFNLRIDGQITQQFSYSWRQRFSKVNSFSDFANNTDWLHLTYRPSKNWAISAGKQVVMIGGWEYDRAPIDLYFCSEYWNNVACYQLGASVAFTTTKGNDTLTFQVCQSPYDSRETDYYAYNLYWMGSHGFYTALHSLNFSQYAPGKYVAYVVLGNQFKFGDATLQLDLMNRGASARELLFDNFSIMGEFSYMVAKRVNIFAKATYDKVGADYPTDLFLFPNTNITRVGGGVEYYPLGGQGNRDIRLHAAYVHTFGANGNPNGTAIDKLGYLTVGLTWRVDVLKTANNIIDKVQARRAQKMLNN